MTLHLGTKKCLWCKKEIPLKIRRDLVRKKFCSHSCRQLWRYKNGEWTMEKMWEKCNTPEANKKKSPGKGSNHPKWIKDRSKIKQKRLNTEEKWFFKEVIAERGYKCELTKEGGSLSVHHKKPVWQYPEMKFIKNNVIVIKTKIHKLFHFLYGFKANEKDWKSFIKGKEYV